MPDRTLYEALNDLPDPRSRHGQFHPLTAIMGLVVLAMLSGRTSLQSIARFGRQHGTSLAHALGFCRGKTPTLSRTLRRMDPTHLEAILSPMDSGPRRPPGISVKVIYRQPP